MPFSGSSHEPSRSMEGNGSAAEYGSGITSVKVAHFSARQSAHLLTIPDNSSSTGKRGSLEMDTSNQCTVVGCGEAGVKLSPHHDPFGPITFDRLAARRMEVACPLHSELLWGLYRKQVSAAMIRASRRGTAAAPTDFVARVSWCLNSHNDPTSKAIASLLALSESA